MIELKILDGKLNKDDSIYRLPKGDYTDALNITHDAIEGSQDTVISNIVGNRIGANYVLPSGRNKCIGAYANTIRNTIIYLIWNENRYDLVLEFDANTRIITPIFENLTDSNDIDITEFTENNKISSINVYNRDEGDLLFFIDSLDRPTFMAIDRMKSKQYVPVNRNIIDSAKNQPLIPPSIVYGNDSSRRVNYLRNRFFRFRYRYVFYDDFKSSCSSYSEVLVPVGILDLDTNNDPTKNNNITLSLFSGDKDVKAIEVLMSWSEKSNVWQADEIVTVLNKTELSIEDNNFFSYIFTNDSTYPVLDPFESVLLFDWIPIKAKCQELLNGNVLGYGAITEGYNKETIPNTVVSVDTYGVTAPTSGSLTQITTYLGGFPPIHLAETTFEGIPAVGTVIEMTIKRKSDNTYVRASLYTTVAGDTNSSAMNGTVGSFGTYSIFDSVSYDGSKKVKYAFNSTLYFDDILVNITAPSTSLASNSIPVWKWSTERNIGIAYFDEKGRTNGILYNTKITFPAYEDNVIGLVFLPQINVSIFDRPPIWAKSYQFLFTKENTYSLYWATNSVNTSETNYIYFEVTDFISNATKFPTTETVLSYSFKDGDRIRLIKPIGVNSYYDDTFDTQILGLLDSPTINGIVETGKRYLKIDKTTQFGSIVYSATNYEIEIYRPQQQTASGTNKTYYECGFQFDILNSGTSLRCHAGQIQDQSTDLSTPATFIFRKGDWYFRFRTIALDLTGVASFNVMDRNIVDTYLSGVNSIDGRPNIIDINAKQGYYGATIRYSQSVQPNTNINGLNRFFEDSFIDVDYSYGSILRMKTRDRFVRIFQELKIGMLPMFSQINKSSTNDNINVITDKLLNPVQYYVGDWGIGSAPESLTSFNFADYGVDNIRGAIWKVSNDGVTPLSILYKMNSWATNELPLRKNEYKCYGAFEQRQNNYVLSLEATTDSLAQTLTYDEERNGFDSFVSYNPEMMVNLGVLFVSFKDGVLWTHDNEPFYNNFYGVQYDSTITPVFNQNEIKKKTFIAVTELASQTWDCPEIETNSNVSGGIKQISNLAISDFDEKEGDYHASFLRATNSPGGLIDGDTLKGNIIKIKLRAINEQPPNNHLVVLNLVTVSSIDSPMTNK
jgi:hypothetical protein